MKKPLYEKCYLKLRKDKHITIVTNMYLEMFFLDSLATRIMEMSMVKMSIDDICNELLSEYQEAIPFSEIHKDVIEMMEFFESNILIKQMV